MISDWLRAVPPISAKDAEMDGAREPHTGASIAKRNRRSFDSSAFGELAQDDNLLVLLMMNDFGLASCGPAHFGKGRGNGGAQTMEATHFRKRTRNWRGTGLT